MTYSPSAEVFFDPRTKIGFVATIQPAAFPWWYIEITAVGEGVGEYTPEQVSELLRWALVRTHELFEGPVHGVKASRKSFAKARKVAIQMIREARESYAHLQQPPYVVTEDQIDRITVRMENPDG